jgi:hypothetical protein
MLRLEQSCLGSHDELQRLSSEAFDLSLTATSWDSRATAMTRCYAAPSENIVLCYENAGAKGYSSLNKSIIESWIEESGRTATMVDFDSARLPSSFQRLIDQVKALRDRSGTALRLLADLSAMPRYVSLGLLSRLGSADLLGSVTFVYETSIYDVSRSDEADAITDPRARRLKVWADARSTTGAAWRGIASLFTKGSWRCIRIPGLDAMDVEIGDASPKHCVVALGFDGTETYRTLLQLGAQKVTSIIPDPPVHDGFVERCLAANRAVLAEWPDPQGVLRCGATDAVGMRDVLLSHHLEEGPVCFLPLGTKPQALGMAVAALDLRRAVVLYRWPRSFVERANVSRGVTYSYKISAA